MLDVQISQDKISNAFNSFIGTAKSIIDANNLLKLEIKKEKEKLESTVTKLNLNDIQNRGNK